MKRLATTLFAMLILVTTITAQSLAERAARRLNRVAEQKAEEVIGRKLERKFGEMMEKVYTMGEDSSTIRMEDDKVIMTDENGNDIELTAEPDEEAMANVQESQWIGHFTMESRQFKGDREDKDSPVMIDYYIDPYDVAFRVPSEEGESIMIMHRRTRKITTLITDENGEKTGMIMPMLRIKANVESADVESAEYSVTATGNTKTIEGFLCEEFQIETEEQSGTAWITKDWAFDYGVLFDFAQVKNTSTGQMTDWSNVYGTQGIALEASMQEKGTNKHTEYYLRNINEGSQSHVFSADGYEIMDMGNLFGN